jgi:capsular exopolysaccharide synthesis family protein
MSRIQNILEKAEREGGVRRIGTLVETAPPASRPLDVVPSDASSPMIAVSAPMTTADWIAATAPQAAAAGPSSPRVVVSTGLDPAVVAALAPGAAIAEQYRTLRTRLAQSEQGAAAAVILVTSPGRGEGKTLTATNLALTIAQDCQTRVCIVDADLRHPRVHALLGVPDTPGLAEVLTGEVTLADALVTLDQQQIAVLPAGKSSTQPAESLGSTAMRRTLQTLRTQFDRVIVDAAAAFPLADVGILAPIVDSVVLVVQAAVTTKPAIQNAVSIIGPDRVLGVVLNGTEAA